jgi:hypothetical protein
MTPSTLFDDDRNIRLAASTRMAAEIGLHLPRTENSNSSEINGVLLTDLRVRIWLLVIDTRSELVVAGVESLLTQSGRGFTMMASCPIFLISS